MIAALFFSGGHKQSFEERVTVLTVSLAPVELPGAAAARDTPAVDAVPPVAALAAAPEKISSSRKVHESQLARPVSKSTRTVSTALQSGESIQESTSAAPSSASEFGARGQYASGSDTGSYDLLVRAHLMAQQRYPERARRRGLEGDLVVRFVIGRDGKVTDKEIVRPSSSVLLDDEALQMIERADPFPSVPINYRVGEELAFRIAVQFTLSR